MKALDDYINTVIVGGDSKNKKKDTVKKAVIVKKDSVKKPIKPTVNMTKATKDTKDIKASKKASCNYCKTNKSKAMTGGSGCGCSAGESMNPMSPM